MLEASILSAAPLKVAGVVVAVMGEETVREVVPAEAVLARTVVLLETGNGAEVVVTLTAGVEETATTTGIEEATVVEVTKTGTEEATWDEETTTGTEETTLTEVTTTGMEERTEEASGVKEIATTTGTEEATLVEETTTGTEETTEEAALVEETETTVVFVVILVEETATGVELDVTTACVTVQGQLDYNFAVSIAFLRGYMVPWILFRE